MESQRPEEENQRPAEEKKMKIPFTDRWKDFQANEKVGNAYQFARTNTRDFIAYVLLIVGLLVLLFEPFTGSLIVGFIFGLYFSIEISFLFNNLNSFVETQGMVRSLILGAVLLSFFLLAPGIFIGAAIAIALKLLFNNTSTPKYPDDRPK